MREKPTNRLEEYGNALLEGVHQTTLSSWTPDAEAGQQGGFWIAEDLPAPLEEYLVTMRFKAVDTEIPEVFVHGDVAYSIADQAHTIQYEGKEPESSLSTWFTRWENQYGVWRFDRDVREPRDAPAEG